MHYRPLRRKAADSPTPAAIEPLSNRRPRPHARRSLLGGRASPLDIGATRQRDPHPTLDEGLWLAEEPQVDAGQRQRLADAVKDQCTGLVSAVDDCARA